MDAKVDDFLNEINEIAPPPKKTEKNESGMIRNIYLLKKIISYYQKISLSLYIILQVHIIFLVWKECQDELTGYSYYWNTKTDEVTWTAPPEFKNRIKQNVQNTNITNKPPVPQKKVAPPENLKIYSLQKDSGKIAQTEAKTSNASKPQKRPYKPNKPESDSEDEYVLKFQWLSKNTR